MLRFLYLFIAGLFLNYSAVAQVTDSVAPSPVDSVRIDTVRVADSVATVNTTKPVISLPISRKPVLTDTGWQLLPGINMGRQVLSRHPFFNYRSPGVVVPSHLRVFQGKETMFYALVCLLLLFAFLKLAFAKYYNDLFRVFFRTTLKQRQIREQLMQTPFPSLMFNGFFVASAGLYLNMVLHHYNFTPVKGFWLMYFYCCVGLAVIYFVKFVGLKICGWLFNMKQAADSYIFIVFIINKVIGIFLLPFIILLAFSSGDFHTVALTLSLAGIGGLLLYRFILGFSAVRNEVRFNLFHFFLYLVAFEAAPLLLIYRVLLLVF